MTAILLLVPAVLAAGVAATTLVPPRSRDRVARALCVVGSGLGVVLFVAADDMGGWRTMASAHGDATAIAGATAAVAWAVAGAGHRPHSDGVLVGVAASSLALFAGNGWVVPALLFWVCALAATSAAAGQALGAHLARFFIVAAGAAVSSGVGLSAWQAGVWSITEPDGILLWVTVGGALAAAGILPVAVWQVADRSSRPAVPLTVGAGFVVIARIGAVDEPWVAVGVLVLALVLALSAWRTRLEVPAVGAWAVATLAGVALVAPDSVVIVGPAAVLTAGAVGLWPNARGRGRLSRGLLLSLAPPTAAFAGLLAAEARAFTRATAAPPDLAWAAIATLLPLALGAGIVLGGVAARTPHDDEFEPRAVLVTWGLLGATLALGVFGQTVVEVPDLIVQAGIPVIYPVALAAGLLVARRATITGSIPESIIETRATGVVQLSRWVALLADFAALGVAVALVSGIVWLTLDGLAAGFL